MSRRTGWRIVVCGDPGNYEHLHKKLEHLLRRQVCRGAWPILLTDQPMARECGICQRNMIVNKIQASILKVALAAAQPMTGGSAPGIAPTRLHSDVFCFSGV